MPIIGVGPTQTAQTILGLQEIDERRKARKRGASQATTDAALRAILGGTSALTDAVGLVANTQLALGDRASREAIASQGFANRLQVADREIAAAKALEESRNLAAIAAADTRYKRDIDLAALRDEAAEKRADIARMFDQQQAAIELANRRTLAEETAARNLEHQRILAEEAEGRRSARDLEEFERQGGQAALDAALDLTKARAEQLRSEIGPQRASMRDLSVTQAEIAAPIVRSMRAAGYTPEESGEIAATYALTGTDPRLEAASMIEGIPGVPEAVFSTDNLKRISQDPESLGFLLGATVASQPAENQQAAIEEIFRRLRQPQVGFISPLSINPNPTGPVNPETGQIITHEGRAPGSGIEGIPDALLIARLQQMAGELPGAAPLLPGGVPVPLRGPEESIVESEPRENQTRRAFNAQLEAIRQALLLPSETRATGTLREGLPPEILQQLRGAPQPRTLREIVEALQEQKANAPRTIPRTKSFQQ